MADSGKPTVGEVIHKTDLDGCLTAVALNISGRIDDEVNYVLNNTTLSGNSATVVFKSTQDLTSGTDTALVEKKAVVDALSKKIEGLVGIDVANPLHEQGSDYLSSTTGYTAPQDCWVVGRCYPDTASENKFTLKINSVQMGYINAYVGQYAMIGFGPIPLKKGQRLTFFVEGRVEYTYSVYGVLI